MRVSTIWLVAGIGLIATAVARLIWADLTTLELWLNAGQVVLGVFTIWQVARGDFSE